LTNDPKKKQAPPLTDWQLAGNEFRAVTVGQRDPPPATPEITSWIVRGNIPPVVLMIVTTFPTIRPLVRKIMNIPDPTY